MANEPAGQSEAMRRPPSSRPREGDTVFDRVDAAIDASERQARAHTNSRMDFTRPTGAPAIHPSHAIMDAEAAAIVFGGHLFEGDNLWNVCRSIVHEDERRVLAENAVREAALLLEGKAATPSHDGRAGNHAHGRLLVSFVEPTTTAGEVAAISAALSQSGIANVPDWQLDERGVPYSIAIFARDER